jgi:hypothetical protein
MATTSDPAYVRAHPDSTMPSSARIGASLTTSSCRLRRQSEEDIRDLFIPNFYFGCEADDRTTAYAFNDRLNHMGVKLKAFFSSDIGHWDVPDMTHVLSDA